MHQRTGVALARAHPEPRKLVAQQRAIVLGVLSQALHGKLLKLAGLLKKVIDAHRVSAFMGHQLVRIDGRYQLRNRLRRVS
jgi:hypothetical protein